MTNLRDDLMRTIVGDKLDYDSTLKWGEVELQFANHTTDQLLEIIERMEYRDNPYVDSDGYPLDPDSGFCG